MLCRSILLIMPCFKEQNLRLLDLVGNIHTAAVVVRTGRCVNCHTYHDTADVRGDRVRVNCYIADAGVHTGFGRRSVRTSSRELTAKVRLLQARLLQASRAVHRCLLRFVVPTAWYEPMS